MKKLSAAAAALTLALALSACSPDEAPSPTQPTTPAPTESGQPEPPSTTPGEIRDVIEGYDLAEVSAALRSQFQSWGPIPDETVAEALNAGCDSLDRTNEPLDGVDAIAAYGVNPIDAGFALMSAISIYCPEHSEHLS